MRIDPKVVVPISAQEPRDAQTPRARGTDADVVKLSPAATSAASSTGEVDKADPEVTAKIAKIRSLLETGAYPIDLNQLASRILDDEKARGGAS